MRFQSLLTVVFLTLAMHLHGQVKWASVEKVYANLITAIGDNSKIAPPIKSSRTESRVAYYSPTRQTIYIEEKFLSVCASFGADSLNVLAFIVGHELAHVYRNHGWVSANGLGYVGGELKDDWKNLRNDETSHAKDESEADIFSGFYTMMAGYNGMEVAEKALTKLYQEYSIPDTVAGYPTLQQRVEISKSARQKANDLYLVFNTGLYCLATQKYGVAADLYTYIYNQDYTGTEILNNLAIAEILMGYNLLVEEPNFYYPIFISTETELESGTRGNEGEEHIKKGIVYLQQALKKEESNPSLYLNLACAYAMLNSFVDANYFLEKARAAKANQSAIENLQAIIAYKNGDIKSAKKIWKSLRADDAFAAKNYQTHIAKKEEVLLATANQVEKQAKIDDIDLTDNNLRKSVDFEVIKLPGLKVSYAKLPNSLLIDVYGGGALNYRFQIFNIQLPDTDNEVWTPVIQSSTKVIQENKDKNRLKIKSLNNSEASSEIVLFYLN